MKPKELILKFIQKAHADAPETEASEGRTESDSNHNEIIRELFDGMSTGTARIIIEQEVGRDIAEQYDIEQIQNKGRYYLAKIVRPDGTPIQRLLVDKQTGTVQMVGR